MNWKQRLFKPKWQNKNADIRLESVSTEHDPQLIGKLVEIAGTDPDERVRCAAIKRLHQLENILKLYSTEKEATVKQLLEERIRQLAAATNETRPPLGLRMQVIEMTKNRDLIEHLASHAPEVELRHAALAKVTRQGVLGDCCIQDTDAGIRCFAGSRITQHTTLKRVIDELRKRDKALHSSLQQRLHQELLEQGDPDAVEAEALGICTALEKLAFSHNGETPEEAGSFFTAWEAISDKATMEMVQRYQRVHERLTAPKPVEKPAPPVISSVPKPDVSDSSEKAETITPPVHANQALADISASICTYQSENAGHPGFSIVRKMRSELELTWQKCKPPHPDDQGCWESASEALAKMDAVFEAKKRQSEEDLARAGVLLEQMETALENGELHKALETRAGLQKIAHEHGKSKAWKPIHARMSGMHARLRELRDWHHWSNNKIRKRLIAEMEVLPAADLHPDALLDRVKSLQVEWKQLEQSEQIPGEKRFMAAPWMWRKFSDAGHKAFDTAKPFLDKRSEIQSRLAESMNEFCRELEELTRAEPTDWNALGKGLSTGRKKLRELGELPARQRQKVAKKLKSALDKGNALVQARYEAVERDKMKLIRAASQLIHLPERSDAISQAKSLQSDWQAAGSLWRSKEQELWNQFREHLDPLFNELKEEQASQKAADDERLKAQRNLCTELADILKNEKDLTALHGKVQGMQDHWKEIEHPDRKLLQKFQDMITEYERKAEKTEMKEQESNRERWWLKADLLHNLTVNGRTAKGSISKKAETTFNKLWPEDSSNDELEIRMDQASKEISGGDVPALKGEDIEEIISRARLLCIGLEFIAGLPSPEEDRQLRMKYQVDRLAHSMSGDSNRQPASEEAADSEKTWLMMYALPDEEYQAFGERVKTALAAINGNN